MEILNFKGPITDLIHILKKGGSIHIKKKNRGKFTDYCGGKVTQECIEKGKKSKDPKIRKRATFADNARKWKHENGGILKYQNPATTLDLPEWSTISGLEPIGVKDENNQINFTLYSNILRPTPEQKFIDKLEPNIPYLPLSRNVFNRKTYQNVRVPVGSSIMRDITDDIRSGAYYDSYTPWIPDYYSFYKDKNTNRIYEIYSEPGEIYGTINKDNFEKIDYDYIKTLLPKRDYIGGTKKDVALKIIDKIPNLKNTILSLASKYGISADLFAQRIGNEGWLQDIAKEYNRSSAPTQKTFAWQDYMDKTIDGFNDLGLDTFGDLHKSGKLNLRRDIDYTDVYQSNEDGTWREYNSGLFKNAYDALEAKAAMFEYFTKVAKERNIPEEDLNAYVNAMYNMGPYHKDLNNMDYVRRTYRVTPYFKKGGVLKALDYANYITKKPI